MSTGQLSETSSIGINRVLKDKGGRLLLSATRVFCERSLHVLQFGQTPALQLTDKGRLREDTNTEEIMLVQVTDLKLHESSSTGKINVK